MTVFRDSGVTSVRTPAEVFETPTFAVLLRRRIPGTSAGAGLYQQITAQIAGTPRVAYVLEVTNVGIYPSNSTAVLGWFHTGA